MKTKADKMRQFLMATVIAPLIMLATLVVAPVANAEPAEAATTIYSMKFHGYAYIGGVGWTTAVWYWVDYNAFEEWTFGKRDCYCAGPYQTVSYPRR